MSLFKKMFGGVKADTVENHYHVKEVLGSGTFSDVKLGIHKKDDKKYAIKMINKKSVGENTEMMENEVEILKRCDHDNIVRLYEIFESNKHLNLVMELVTGGELFDRIVDIGSFSEKDAAKLCRDVFDALNYLHKQDIVHRDLKPENLLFSSEANDAKIKLADFGLSRLLGDEEETVLKTACGTPGYVAPEVLHQRGYGKEVDMWSMGVILYILLCGFPPFYDDNTAVLFEQIMSGEYDYPSPYWDDVSSSAKNLIDHLLVVDPAERYTAEQCLSHPWIKHYEKQGSVVDLASARTELKKFNARRRFKGAIKATMAAQRMKHLQELLKKSKIEN